jgi:hypothetical protein
VRFLSVITDPFVGAGNIRNGNEATAQFIIMYYVCASAFGLFPSPLVLPSCASTEPTATAQFSYQLVVTVRGRIRSWYWLLAYDLPTQTPNNVNDVNVLKMAVKFAI